MRLRSARNPPSCGGGRNAAGAARLPVRERAAVATAGGGRGWCVPCRVWGRRSAAKRAERMPRHRVWKAQTEGKKEKEPQRVAGPPGSREYYSVTASVRETEGRTRCCRVCAVSQSPAVCAADCRWGRWPFCVVFVCFCLGRLSFKTCLLTLWSLLTWGKKPPQQGALTCDIRAWRGWRCAFPQPEHLNLPEVPWRHSHKQRQPG